MAEKQNPEVELRSLHYKAEGKKESLVTLNVIIWLLYNNLITEEQMWIFINIIRFRMKIRIRQK